MAGHPTLDLTYNLHLDIGSDTEIQGAGPREVPTDSGAHETPELARQVRQVILDCKEHNVALYEKPGRPGQRGKP